MQINMVNLVFILLITILGGGISLIFLKTIIEKIYFSMFILGFFIYCGFGGSYYSSSRKQIMYYTILLFVVSFSFVIGCIVFRDRAPKLIRDADEILKIDNKIWNIYIYIYILFCLIPLMYPNFRLLDLLKPMTPNLNDAFSGNNIMFTNIFDSVYFYLNLMLFPIFLISINKIKKNKYMFIGIIFLQSYILYCSKNYLSRNVILTIILFTVLVLWYNKIISSKKVILLAIIGITLFPVFYYIYGVIRIGGDIDIKNINFGEVLNKMISMETTYGKYLDNIIGRTFDIHFLQYLLYFPLIFIPKFGKLNLINMNINTMFTYIITGAIEGSYGYSVVLPSLLGESIIIFDKYYFWIHGITVGIIFSFTCCILQKYKSLRIMAIYFSISFFWISRAGIEGVYSTMMDSVIIIIALINILRLKKYKVVI